jgi:hypothetical protein
MPWRKELSYTVEEGAAATTHRGGRNRRARPQPGLLPRQRERERVKNRWLHVVKIRMRTPPCWTRERERKEET